MSKLHVEALKEIFKQFDSYKSNCEGCEKVMDCCGNSDICENNDLICRNKLMEAAEELDNK